MKRDGSESFCRRPIWDIGEEGRTQMGIGMKGNGLTSEREKERESSGVDWENREESEKEEEE